MTTAISKITRAGQITLPKNIRSRGDFARARAVEFVETNGTLVLRPVLAASPILDEDAAVINHTMREWLDAEHDDLFILK